MTETTAQKPRNTRGRVVGVIAIYDDPKGTQGRPDAPITIVFSENRYRKDFHVKQSTKKGSFSPYARELLDSCFRNWKEDRP